MDVNDATPVEPAAGPRDLLVDGLGALGIPAGEPLVEALLTHLALLRRWNRAYNLTAVDDPLRAVAVHLLDSLAVAPYLRGHRVIDAGTGAGFPGLPLALMRPSTHFVLLDSRGKKVRFVDTVIRATGIGNAETVQARLAQYPAEGKFDTLVARAFSSLSSIYDDGRRLLAPGGRILALKGQHPGEEIEALNRQARVRLELVRLKVPYLDAARHLAVIEPDE